MISNAGRLILPEPGSATWNMSLDQAIMESVNRQAMQSDDVGPTLRFYTWTAPSLSLGYFQEHKDAVPRFTRCDTGNDYSAADAAIDPVEVVRRSTGGGAILHHHELTYSITIPTPAGDSGARHDLYTGVHQSIVEVLASEGVSAKPFREDNRLAGNESAFLCFQRRTDEDLIVSGYKILGSAQRRSQRAVLQHGSLLIRSSEFAPELPGISDLTSRSLSQQELAAKIALRIADRFDLQLKAAPVTADERIRSEQIQNERFGSPKWTLRR